ncbi:helix-turn-helix domain-containing protein [Tolypothrix sp. PCC 7910]|uniref:dynamin family protein n=1 Tax=Tolypothrix sp. PCC 7910 TaxID=2099387 RepID=UPI001427808C|nr:dynamin family protein [Tolypothrix sp. PCC 7910]QIR39903.1 helix-turn-helix domain-containing protein [Tolypothrix sp. PCC 7910]
MNINLQAYRQKIGMTQAELAKILDISTIEVEAYEQAPDSVPMGLLVKWLQDLGVDLATAMSAPIPPLKGIDPGTPYTELYRKLNLLNQYIEATPHIEKLDIPTPPVTPTDLKQQLKLYKQKPNVILTGGFDAGKSHLANALLGSKNLPVGYQPATRVITFVRHIEDRPAWFKKDVLIVNEDFWTKDEKDKQIIDFLLLDDQERCEKSCVQAGGFDTLQKYGVHGEYEDIAAHAAVVYIDSPLLQACNLIDLPGFSDQPDEASQDVEKANSAAKIADVVLYASPAKGHINDQDMRRLSNLLSLLPARENESTSFPTLGNLFIVATHADPSISDNQLKEIPNKAASRLYKQLNEGVLKTRRELTNRTITLEDFRTRFFTFWSERPDRCKQLFDDFKKIVGKFLPQAHMCRVEREINAMKEANTEKYAKQIESYQRTLTDIDSRRKQLQVLEENEATRKQDTKQKRDKVYQHIRDCQIDTRISFQKYAESLLAVDAVEKIILNHYDDKNEAKEGIAGFLVEKLQHEAEQRIKLNSDKLTYSIESFLGSYQEALLKLPNLDVSIEIPFDAKGAFLGGLTGLTSIGALSAWAAALGNLGGYILVAKLVSILSALGISISGGTAAVISFVAAIGGPIVLGVGLFAALAFAAWGLFGESWQKRLAKQTVKYFQEQRVSEKFTDGIDQFWRDTIKSFEKGANAVEADWNKYIEHLREITSPTTESKDRIEEIIKILEAGKDFFATIPWANVN